ncbi:glycosyltransferase, partial [Corynebacterium pseudodiphtheriticum]
MVTESSVQNPDTAWVSVVIPCYRCKETIRRALDSVYHQSLRPAEVILVDDASPDNTLNFLFEL